MRTIVVIDDREDHHHHFSRVLPALLKKKGKPHEISFQVKRLLMGDLAVFTGKTVHVLELKEVSDFYQSFLDGRLYAQALRSRSETLLNHQVRGFSVIIYGSWEQAYTRLRSRNDKFMSFHEWLDRIHATMLTLTYRYNVTLWKVASHNELNRFLVSLVLRESKGAGPVTRVPVSPVKSSQDPRIDVLSVLPQIGQYKARLLLQYFLSPLRVFLHPSPHQVVPGIGEKVTQSIAEFIRVHEEIIIDSFSPETNEISFTLRKVRDTRDVAPRSVRPQESN